ncbi:MAG: polyketide synthase, partial [Myxococcota bacterium]
MSEDSIGVLADSMEQHFKSVFAPVNEDTLAGGLANTIAGRICNYLNLNGGGYTVDGACSSSLLAIHSAATGLANGTSDFAIAGGIDISLDPFELIGFAKTGALTPTQMSVYDRRGNGFIPGEGCGFVGMKRLEDAKRDQDRVYAILDGWGMSSDGKGGITAPSVHGQSMALRRAYEQAGIVANDIDFIEGHGTGTTVGDRTELLGIAKALSEIGTPSKRRCGVTSFKSIVGHTKAAAGVGAFIKAVMAVNQRVIPPTAGCEQPHDVFSDDSSPLYPVVRGKVLEENAQLRAGVSAMGFGGINVHVTLKSADAPLQKISAGTDKRSAMASYQDSEVYCLAGWDRADLQRVAQQMLS